MICRPSRYSPPSRITSRKTDVSSCVRPDRRGDLSTVTPTLAIITIHPNYPYSCSLFPSPRVSNPWLIAITVFARLKNKSSIQFKCFLWNQHSWVFIYNNCRILYKIVIYYSIIIVYLKCNFNKLIKFLKN